MPSVKIKTPSGSVQINYTISTPTNDNAKSIDKNLPTVLFLHPVYVGHAMFHHQFASQKLRRCNLVGFDWRCHGETIGAVPSNFRRKEAADDVAKFMEALKLPHCHLFGVSLGACVALQTAISYPDKVLSLFMLSPLPLIEPEIVGAGRQEIYDCWVDGCKDPKNIDQDALLDAIFGALQLGFNGGSGSMTTSLVQYTVPQGMKNWSSQHFEEFHTVSVKFFIDRKPHPREVLSTIKTPIHLVHCGGDIAYPIHYAEELRDALKDAGVDVRLSQVEAAPHFGNVTHSEPVNALFHDWIMENTRKINIPPAKPTVKSPFEAALIKCGYIPGEGNASDSEDDFFH
ncbi:unnamed protein product [Cyclocybe aegerita]|uniref:AB hydrolase-1 domain-containing protein n=1 Tax=Cyclocybe aegerita TaxID=1973307 RepID=A0A8S0VRP0_CYCAE|nr:unnamed protein product [Cyclocybe aegerita]